MHVLRRKLFSAMLYMSSLRSQRIASPAAVVIDVHAL